MLNGISLDGHRMRSPMFVELDRFGHEIFRCTCCGEEYCGNVDMRGL